MGWKRTPSRRWNSLGSWLYVRWDEEQRQISWNRECMDVNNKFPKMDIRLLLISSSFHLMAALSAHPCVLHAYWRQEMRIDYYWICKYMRVVTFNRNFIWFRFIDSTNPHRFWLNILQFHSVRSCRGFPSFVSWAKKCVPSSAESWIYRADCVWFWIQKKMNLWRQSRALGRDGWQEGWISERRNI